MRWDGKDKRQLSKGKSQNVHSFPRWSPNGKSLLISSSSPYHMGGPTDGFRDFYILGLDGKAKGVNNRDEGGQVVSGTFFDPFWSRDGRRVLFSYSPQSADYVSGDSTSLQVGSLEGAPLSEFKNNWNDFLVDNQSRDGAWRIAHEALPGYEAWDRFRSGTTYSLGTVWPEGSGFHATRFCVSDDGQKLIVQGNLQKWGIDARGYATSTIVRGIWFSSGTNENFKPRVLVENAELVDWL